MTDLLKDNGKSYYDQVFHNFTYTKEKLSEKEFEKCKFERVNLVECILEKCKFIDCVFTDCLLSACSPTGSSFVDLKFKNSKVTGVDFTKAKSIRDLEFENCVLDYSNFSLLKLSKIKMVNCAAHEADFTEADLTEGDFSGTDFERSRFFKTILTRANFKGAVNYAIDVKNNAIKKAKFCLPEAVRLLDGLGIVLVAPE